MQSRKTANIMFLCIINIKKRTVEVYHVNIVPFLGWNKDGMTQDVM